MKSALHLDEVRDKKECSGSLEPGEQMLEGKRQIRLDRARFDVPQRLQNLPGLPGALLKRNVQLDLVGERQQPHFHIVAGCGESQDRGDPDKQLPLRLVRAGKFHRAGKVGNDHSAQFFFFKILFDKRVTHARGGVPVDLPVVIAMLVALVLIEFEAPASQGASIIANLVIPHRFSNVDLDVAKLFHQCSRKHIYRPPRK